MLVGYANGAALILVGTQLPVLLGVALPRDAFFLRVFDAIVALPEANLATVTLGVALVAMILLLDARGAARARGARRVRGCGRGLARLRACGARRRPPRPAAASIPMPSLPRIALGDLQALAPGAIALALLVFAEGMLMARTLAAKRREPVDADHELIALGAANVAAGLVERISRRREHFALGHRGRQRRADPARAVDRRGTAGAVRAVRGARAPRTAARRALRDPDRGGRAAHRRRRVAHAARLDRHAFGIAAGVTVGVLVLGVLPGVLLGVGLSLARILIEVARPRDAVLRRLPTDRRFHDLADDEGGANTPAVIVYRLYAPLLFANARYVADRLRALAAQARPAPRCVVLDLQAVSHIDVTALGVLRELHDEFEARGIDVRFARANRPLREQILRWIGDEQLGHERFFPSASAAVDDFLATHPTQFAPGRLSGFELGVLERQPLDAGIAEVDLHARVGAAPSASMMTPTPNLAWRTLWPMRHCDAGGVACGAAVTRSHSASSTSAMPACDTATATARARAGSSSTKREGML